MKVWGWGNPPEDADPWDRPEQKNAADPWDRPDQRKAADPWDSPAQTKTQDPWDGAGWVDNSVPEQAEEPSAVQEQDYETPDAAEQDYHPTDSTEQENELSDNPAQEDKTSANSLDLGAQIACAVMTLVAYGILFRMPDEMTWASFGAFFLSILLFCIGLSALAMDMPKPDTKAGVVLRNMGICAVSAGVLAGAVWFVIRRNGSQGGICAATVLMIQCMVFLYGLDESWRNSKAAKYAFRAVSIGLGGYAVWMIIRLVLSDSDVEDGLLAAATLLLIASLVIFDTFGKRVEKQTRRIVHRKGKYRRVKNGQDESWQENADGMEKETLVE